MLVLHHRKLGQREGHIRELGRGLEHLQKLVQLGARIHGQVVSSATGATGKLVA